MFTFVGSLLALFGVDLAFLSGISDWLGLLLVLDCELLSLDPMGPWLERPLSLCGGLPMFSFKLLSM